MFGHLVSKTGSRMASVALAALISYNAITYCAPAPIKAPILNPETQKVYDLFEKIHASTNKSEFDSVRADVLHKVKLLLEDPNSNPLVLFSGARAIFHLYTANETSLQADVGNVSLLALKRAIDFYERNNQPAPAQFYRWRGLVYSELANVVGIREITTYLNLSRADFERSVQLDGSDPSSHHFLGRWHYGISALSGWKRRIITAAGREGMGNSFENALQSFETAERVQPHFWKMNMAYIGLSLARLCKKDEAESVITSLSTDKFIPASDDLDAEKKISEIQSLLKKC